MTPRTTSKTRAAKTRKSSCRNCRGSGRGWAPRTFCTRRLERPPFRLTHPKRMNGDSAPPPISLRSCPRSSCGRLVLGTLFCSPWCRASFESSIVESYRRRTGHPPSAEALLYRRFTDMFASRNRPHRQVALKVLPRPQRSCRPVARVTRPRPRGLRARRICVQRTSGRSPPSDGDPEPDPPLPTPELRVRGPPASWPCRRPHSPRKATAPHA